MPIAINIDRDLYSAFLAICVEKVDNKYILNVDLAKKLWSGVESLLADDIK